MKKYTETAIAILVVGVVLASCTAGPNSSINHANIYNEVAGFWLGLWHGTIAVFSFIYGLFEPTVRVYEVHNNGNWYDSGFLLGVGCFAGSSSSTAYRARR